MLRKALFILYHNNRPCLTQYPRFTHTMSSVMLLRYICTQRLMASTKEYAWVLTIFQKCTRVAL